MGKPQRKSAFTETADYIPEGGTLAELAEAVEFCRGCDLYRNATHGVFGEGPEDAPVVFVGEQPGDQEDRQGRPFVGPAGRLLSRALEDAGIDRHRCYFTNAVKHFKHETQGKRRLHKKPGTGEVDACHPWLEAELQRVRPKLVVCLGTTALRSVLGRTVTLKSVRGEALTGRGGEQVFATTHPSAVLRVPDKQARERAYRELVRDLEEAKSLLPEFDAWVWEGEDRMGEAGR